MDRKEAAAAVRKGHKINVSLGDEQALCAPILRSYTRFIVAFSGGKDSLACLLALLDSAEREGCLEYVRERTELWHHEIDGREGSDLMDWTITRDYCRAVADAFQLPIFYSWKVGGFEREMLRENALTAPIAFETPEGTVEHVGGVRGKPSTRRRFPQQCANLGTRWCSAYLKIDVCAAAIRNQKRFNGERTLVLTGERAEESSCRARYREFERDRSDNRNGRTSRYVDHWRAVHKWTNEQVWAAIRRHGVVAHPCYQLGFGRCSCMCCIFASKDQWATIRKIAPRQFDRVARYETEFDCTINTKRAKGKVVKITVNDMADAGTAYDVDSTVAEQAVSSTFAGPVVVDPATWELPKGWNGESCALL